MGALIHNEFIKLTSNKKFYILLVILVATLITTSLSSIKDARNIEPHKQLESINKNISFLQGMIDKNSVSIDKKNMYETQIKTLNEQKNEIQEDISFPKTDWKLRLKTEIINLEKQKNKSSDINNIEELNSLIRQKEYYIEKGIIPENNYELTSLNIIPKGILLFNLIFLGLLIAIISSDIVSGENNPPTIRLLLLKPVSKIKILTSKYLMIFFTCLTSIISIEVIAFMVLGIIFKFGNPLTPVLARTKFHYDSINNLVNVILGSTRIIPLWNYLLEIVLIQILFIMVCVSFGLFMSCFFKKAVSSISVSFLILSTLSFLTIQSGMNSKIIKKLMPFIFTTYSNSFDLISGNINQKLNCDFISLPFSICIMIAWSVTFYALSCLIFYKRDCLV